MSVKALTPAQIGEIEARLAALPDPDLTDPDNPEWTAQDFAHAEGPESLSPEVLAAFPSTRPRGRPPKLAPKKDVKLRLDPEVLDHLRQSGKGWQTRVNAQLAAAIKAGKL